MDTDFALDVGGNLCWRNSLSLSHGFPFQICPNNWHSICVHSVMAVGEPRRFHHFYPVLIFSVFATSRNTAITYFPYTDEGNARFEFFKNVVSFHPIQNTLGQLDWQISTHPSQFALALFTFLYVDIIDATATLYSMVRFCGVVDPKDGDFPRSTIAYCTDGACLSIGALLGSSPVTAFIESGAGIAEGGRTGLTAMVTGVCFLLSIFLAPIIASIPPWATGCTLILVSYINLCVSSWLLSRVRERCVVVDVASVIGWLHDDTANYTNQLEVYWRRAALLCGDEFYTV